MYRARRSNELLQKKVRELSKKMKLLRKKGAKTYTQIIAKTIKNQRVLGVTPKKNFAKNFYRTEKS